MKNCPSVPLAIVCLFTALTGCSDAPADDPEALAMNPLSKLVVDPNQITVSGLSSGGYMASQLHIAHSNTFSGAGVIAAGPWWCSRGQITRALNLCIKGGEFSLNEIAAEAQALARDGKIDPLVNLNNDPVWIFHGTRDVTVAADVVESARQLYDQFYDQLGVPKQAVLVSDIPAAHAIPTVDRGAACAEFSPPYINACNYDMAGEMLQHLTGRSATKAPSATGQILSLEVPDAKSASLQSSASVYVPEQCAAGTSCGIHVALHGCQQSAEVVGDAFIVNAGYNRWADALNLIVLYPQVASSSLAPMNPLGCWDWWGYTGPEYVTQSAPQIAAIKHMLDTLSGAKQ